jgi:hypothetical protein
MRKPKQRHKKVSVDERLVALFRAAVPAAEALHYDASHDKRRMTTAEHVAACAAVHAFNKAAGVMPWEHGPLDPEEGGPGSLRDALLAMMDGKDEVHDGGLAGRAQRRPEAAGG